MMPLGWKVWAATEKELNIGNRYPTDIVELGQYEGNAKALIRGNFNSKWAF